MTTHDEDWYWDLDKRRAVPANERGPADNTLGPYASKAEAENWKATADKRNDAWDDADDEWREGDPKRD
jgi:hypothetical protein